MKRTIWLQETRKMRFEEAFGGWRASRLTQEEAGRLLGVSERTFRRLICRYEDEGLEGLLDKRLNRPSARRAPVDEIMALQGRYRTRHAGWNVKHFYWWYRQDGGTRSYTWVKKTLQQGGLVQRAPKRGAHRKRRERSPLPGMMIHQDGSSHEWAPGKRWDLIVTMDDATNEHYSLFFVDQEGTASSFRGIRDLIRSRGLFSTFYVDRGSHYWTTPRAGGSVDREHLPQVTRALHQLGITVIPANSPQARGRCERVFSTHQDRLPKELALHRITTMDTANRYIERVYLPAYNAEFRQLPLEQGSAFVPFVGDNLDDILCEQFERTVSADNCVSFARKTLQIPPNQHRCHYVRAKVRVHRYLDGSLAIFHGPRKLADYHPDGSLKIPRSATSARRGRRVSPPKGRHPKADNSCATKPDNSICC